MSLTKQEALSIHSELASLISANLGGREDAATLKRIQELCWQLKLESGEIATKAASVEEFAGILYSQQKHREYDVRDYKGQYVSGVDNVRGVLRNDLASLRLIIGRMSEKDSDAAL